MTGKTFSYPVRAVAAILVVAVCTVALRAGGELQGATPAEPAFTVDDLLDLVDVRIEDLSRDGRWLVASASTRRDRVGIDNARYGDPTYISPSVAQVWIVDTRSGEKTLLFSDRKQTRGFQWSPDGTRLAYMVLNGDRFRPVIWNRLTGEQHDVQPPSPKVIAENALIQWSPDGTRLIFSVRDPSWYVEAERKFNELTQGPVVVLSSEEPFLAWEALRRMSSIVSVVEYDTASGQSRELIGDKALNAYYLSPDGEFILYEEDITKKTDYDVIFGRDNQVRFMPLAGGETRTVISSTKGLRITWSRTRRHYTYSKNGNLFWGSVDDAEPGQLTGKETTPAGEETDSRNDTQDAERYTALGLSHEGRWILASSKSGLWLFDAVSGSRELFLEIPEDDKEAPQYRAIDWSPEGHALYLSYNSRKSWERGFVRYDPSKKQLTELLKDSHLYSDVQLSHDGSTFVFSRAAGNRPEDIYTADNRFANVRRLSETNANLDERKLGKTELIPYLDVDGKKLYGVLYYPLGYQRGTLYPTIFHIYEQFFDDSFNSSLSLLTSAGYAVMRPSVDFERGYPGEAWMKGVNSAANKLIDMGIADPERLGVHGTSYGGYATNLLITQTNRFKAAINISGKVNMVSFYTDSPRLGVRNIHAPEKSQDRIGATLWEQPQKYMQHSAVLFADRIQTPLLLITGEQDHNVPARQAMEMYYALRRLGKKVQWVNYLRGGHGMPTTTEGEIRDYHDRILRWFDEHLKGDLKKETQQTTGGTP